MPPRARLWVHYLVREDAQLFYGFATRAERELFPPAAEACRAWAAIRPA